MSAKTSHDAPLAWLVAVEMEALAAHLAVTYRRPHTVFDAKRWLTQAGSPFYATDRWGTFYAKEDPAGILADDEVESIEPAQVIYIPSRATPIPVVRVGPRKSRSRVKCVA